MKVDILLSTYNSQNYLRELLDSLWAQYHKNWQLLVRDDGSTDNTTNILSDFEDRYPEKITYIKDNEKSLGPKRSFENLLNKSSADYIMFCDHDDYWLPHKISDSLLEIQKLEENTPNKAALVFTDLKVVDEKLNVIHPSFWKYSKVDPNNIFNPYKLVINNPAPGCTLLINKTLKKLVLPFPKEVRMHDWWITLRAAESGVASFCKEPSILYRQHENNTIGAEAITENYLKGKVLNIKNTWKENVRTYKMMKCLEKNYSILKLIYYKIIISLSKLS